MPIPRIASVTPLEDKKILVEFENGISRVYDCTILLNTKGFEVLRDDAFFGQVRVSVDGRRIFWADKLGLSSEEIWKNGIPVQLLKPNEITLADAAEKYALPKTVLLKWIQAGVIHVIRRQGQMFILDDNEVRESAAYFYERRREAGGKKIRVFDAKGNPIVSPKPKNRS